MERKLPKRPSEVLSDLGIPSFPVKEDVCVPASSRNTYPGFLMCDEELHRPTHPQPREKTQVTLKSQREPENAHETRASASGFFHRRFAVVLVMGFK